MFISETYVGQFKEVDYGNVRCSVSRQMPQRTKKQRDGHRRVGKNCVESEKRNMMNFPANVIA